MNRREIIQLIDEITGEEDPSGALESSLRGQSKEELGVLLLECGIIPERFTHDSTQEKLWAKYCDMLLSLAFSFLGIQSEVLRTRGETADVLGKTADYSIVGDAKAFRLSRSAKNQKDFKVTALDDWRKGSTFACLVAPLYQYPGKSSQIYAQAAERNVTLLSYIHLRFLLDHPPRASMMPLWEIGQGLAPSKDARRYWAQVDGTVLDLTGRESDDLDAYKQLEMERTREIGREEIEYWERVMERYHTLSHEEAVRRLIRAEKIENRIRMIRRTIFREA